MHSESLAGIMKTLLAALRRTLVEPWPPQPLGKRRGACGLQRIAHPPARALVAQLSHLFPSPPPPKLLKTALLPYSWYQGQAPEADFRDRGCIRDGLRPLPPTSKRNLGLQLCWVRGLSNSPKSPSGSSVMLRGSKMAPESGSLEPQNSPSRPEAHPGRALALPARREPRGSMRAAADCTSPGAASVGSASQPTSP